MSTDKTTTNTLNSETSTVQKHGLINERPEGMSFEEYKAIQREQGKLLKKYKGGQFTIINSGYHYEHDNVKGGKKRVYEKPVTVTNNQKREARRALLKPTKQATPPEGKVATDEQYREIHKKASNE